MALIWVAVTRVITPLNFTLGFALGFVILGLLGLRGVVDSPQYGRRVFKIVGFSAFFVYELVLANIRMASEVFRPRSELKPGVVAVPLDIKGDSAIAFLANVITLTPGTLSLDVSPDRKTLYVHVMKIKGGDVDKVVQEIKDGFERRLIELFDQEGQK
ncbi:MAG: Na+/H+ antiporter subunit E [Fimbriimonadaceae bacterium]|nr:Na+/H+ antiporter subunit E [Fimbriimonadaceae bacterium]